MRWGCPHSHSSHSNCYSSFSRWESGEADNDGIEVPPSLMLFTSDWGGINCRSNYLLI
jgi:hypothetical protein